MAGLPTMLSELPDRKANCFQSRPPLDRHFILSEIAQLNSAPLVKRGGNAGNAAGRQVSALSLPPPCSIVGQTMGPHRVDRVKNKFGLNQIGALLLAEASRLHSLANFRAKIG